MFLLFDPNAKKFFDGIHSPSIGKAHVHWHSCRAMIFTTLNEISVTIDDIGHVETVLRDYQTITLCVPFELK